MFHNFSFAASLKPSSSQTTIISNQEKSLEFGSETPQLKYKSQETASEMEIYYNGEHDTTKGNSDNSKDLERIPSENGQLALQQTDLTEPAIAVDMDSETKEEKTKQL